MDVALARTCPQQWNDKNSANSKERSFIGRRSEKNDLSKTVHFERPNGKRTGRFWTLPGKIRSVNSSPPFSLPWENSKIMHLTGQIRSKGRFYRCFQNIWPFFRNIYPSFQKINTRFSSFPKWPPARNFGVALFGKWPTSKLIVWNGSTNITRVGNDGKTRLLGS